MNGHPWITHQLITEQHEQIARDLAERRRRPTRRGRNRRYAGAR